MLELRQTGFNEVPGGGIFYPGEPHLACVLLLDTSGSMAGDPIDSLNRAISDFKEQTSLDEHAQKRVDIAIVEFNDEARVVQEFTPLPLMQPIKLTAGGCTAMGAGIELAIDKVKERYRFYASMGTPCFKPFIFLITDGEATDDLKSACDRLNENNRRKVELWALGIEGYNNEELQRIADEVFSIEYDFDVCEAMMWIFTKMNHLRRDNRAVAYMEEIDFQKIEKDIPDGLHVLHKDTIW